MSKKGMFITFEGPDGSGKSTQIRLFQERLAKEGIPCLVTREPGGTTISNRIRELLLDPMCTEMFPITEVYLYAASRAQHVAEIIGPAIENGELVLCDRYIDASIAYQAAGLGLQAEFVRRVSEEATNGLWPIRTYLLDIPVSIGAQRISKRDTAGPDRIEARNASYHERVRQEFLLLSRRDPQRVKLLDGSQTVSEIAEQIWQDWTLLSQNWR